MSAPEKIPDDIDRIATDLVRKSYREEDEPDFAAYLAIARAILAERERCAKIADEALIEPAEDEELGGDDWWSRKAANGQASVIAARIRGEHP